MNIDARAGMSGEARVCCVRSAILSMVSELDNIGALPGDRLNKTGTICQSFGCRIGSGDDGLAQAAWPLLAIQQFRARSVILLDPERRRFAPLSIC